MSERMRYAYTYGPGRPLTVTIVTPENMAAVMLVMAAEYAADAGGGDRPQPPAARRRQALLGRSAGREDRARGQSLSRLGDARMFVYTIQDCGIDGWKRLRRLWLADEDEALVASIDWFYLTREHYAPIEDEL
jgi:hypothetical protein